jgi:ketosteroid isomerase-like protein
MSTVDRATVMRYYERVDAKDVPGVVALFAEDAVYRRPGYEPIAGHAALTDFYANQRVIDTGRHTVTGLVCEGPNIAVQGRFSGRLVDGSTAELEFADFFQVQDGVFVQRTTYFYAPLV